MTNYPELHQQWSDFLAAWPADRVREMTLEEYTNPGKDDAFIYWIESRLDKLGSIWGGSAFKFGIYCRDNTTPKDASFGRAWGEKYAWIQKYGTTEQEAFATIRGRLVEVIEASQARNFARVDELELALVLKWKVAFLYQDRSDPTIFPVFKKEALFRSYRSIDPRAKVATMPYHVMYQTLMEQHRALGDVFAVAKAVWDRQVSESKGDAGSAWAVPLAWTVADPAVLEKLCSKTTVEPEDVDPFLDNVLSGADLSEGDRIALLIEGDVRALGTLKSVEASQFSWEQTPVNFPSPLVVNPSSEVRALTAAERKELWSHLPAPPAPPVAPHAGPRYWKIAPGRNAVAWPYWLQHGIAAIGGPALGDLTSVSREEFDRRAAKCEKEHDDYSKGMSQVWAFRSIRPGDRVLANQGKHTVLAFGTVVSGYQFVPGVHEVNGEDYAHQIGVRWEDTAPRPIAEAGFQRTLLELSRAEFEALLNIQVGPPPPSPPARPCEPRNVILYGPPGTGKTYSTIRRALELTLGADKLEGLGDKGLLALFREHQARGQIEFVTFHQAYGYEEFVEGIRPVLDETASAEVRYEVHDGVFKRIALKAAGEGLRAESTAADFDELWDLLVRDIRQEGGRLARGLAGKTYQLEISNQGSVLAHVCEVDAEGNITPVKEPTQTASKENSRLYWKHAAELGPEPENFTYQKTTQLFARLKGGTGGNHYTALWIVYSQLYALSRAAGARQGELIHGRVQQALDKPGPTTTFSFSADSAQYVLIIDEVNRGNVSKILGELITLLEPDKRLTARNELKLPLSYSPQHRFAVPPNLHVVGTMNTADRSIALMDVALRRRFTFEELMPEVGVIRSELEKRVSEPALIDLVCDVFEAINGRIRFLYDRDHQLGHSYFLDVTDAESLRRVFVDRVVPMLQEYFYGAWDKICIVLGCPYTETGELKRRDGHLLDGKAYAQPIVTAKPFPEVTTLGFDHDDYEDRVDHQVRSKFQQGSLPPIDLYRTFLGVLPIGPEEYETRLAKLIGEPPA